MIKVDVRGEMNCDVRDNTCMSEYICADFFRNGKKGSFGQEIYYYYYYTQNL